METRSMFRCALPPSFLQFEVEGVHVPLVDVTVQHVSLCEGHVSGSIYEDDRVSPKWKQNTG